MRLLIHAVHAYRTHGQHIVQHFSVPHRYRARTLGGFAGAAGFHHGFRRFSSYRKHRRY